MFEGKVGLWYRNFQRFLGTVKHKFMNTSTTASSRELGALANVLDAHRVEDLLADLSARKIIEALAERRVVTLSELFARTLIDYDVLRNRLYSLKSDGFVDSTPEDRFMLSRAGDVVARLL